LDVPVRVAWRGLPNRNFNPTGEVIANMLAEGFNVDPQALDEVTWREHKNSGDTAYSGIFAGTAHGSNDDSLLVSKYSPFGTDKVSTEPIPGITDEIETLRRELDVERRNQLIRQLQNRLAVYMPDFPAETQQREFQL